MTEIIRLAQSSMQFSDGARGIDRDTRMAFDTDADFIAFSEAGPSSYVRQAINGQALRRDYFLTKGYPGDVMIAVHPKHKVLQEEYTKVLDARSGFPKGNYRERGIMAVQVRTPGGNIIWDHTAHWVTAFRLDTKPGVESDREEKHRKQTLAMIDHVRRHGAGIDIAFWQGDTNVDEGKDKGADKDAPHHLFTKNGLISIFDDVGKYPSTHHGPRGSTLDIIGRYANDRRVAPAGFMVDDNRSSDHFLVVASYLVADPRDPTTPFNLGDFVVGEMTGKVTHQQREGNGSWTVTVDPGGAQRLPATGVRLVK